MVVLGQCKLSHGLVCLVKLITSIVWDRMGLIWILGGDGWWCFHSRGPWCLCSGCHGVGVSHLMQTLALSDWGVMDADVVGAALVVAALCLLLTHFAVACFSLGGSFAGHFELLY